MLTKWIVFVICFNERNKTFIQECFREKPVGKMENVSALFFLKICYLFVTMFPRIKFIMYLSVCLWRRFIIYVVETWIRHMTQISGRNWHWGNTWHFSAGNTGRYIDRPAHRVDDRALSESHQDSLSVSGRDGRWEGHSRDKIQRLCHTVRVNGKSQSLPKFIVLVQILFPGLYQGCKLPRTSPETGELELEVMAPSESYGRPAHPWGIHACSRR